MGVKEKVKAEEGEVEVRMMEVASVTVCTEMCLYVTQ